MRFQARGYINILTYNVQVVPTIPTNYNIENVCIWIKVPVHNIAQTDFSRNS